MLVVDDDHGEVVDEELGGGVGGLDSLLIISIVILGVARTDVMSHCICGSGVTAIGPKAWLAHH
jgi:hypothetical protein